MGGRGRMPCSSECLCLWAAHSKQRSSLSSQGTTLLPRPGCTPTSFPLTSCMLVPFGLAVIQAPCVIPMRTLAVRFPSLC